MKITLPTRLCHEDREPQPCYHSIVHTRYFQLILTMVHSCSVGITGIWENVFMNSTLCQDKLGNRPRPRADTLDEFTKTHEPFLTGYGHMTQVKRVGVNYQKTEEWNPFSCCRLRFLALCRPANGDKSNWETWIEQSTCYPWFFFYLLWQGKMSVVEKRK